MVLYLMCSWGVCTIISELIYFYYTKLRRYGWIYWIGMFEVSWILCMAVPLVRIFLIFGQCKINHTIWENREAETIWISNNALGSVRAEKGLDGFIIRMNTNTD